jgi:hypothetical protein
LVNEVAVVGIISILVGLVVCLRGYVALRVIITLLGAWVGFLFGAALMAGITDDGFLGVTLAWVGAIVGALVLGLLAFAFYQVAVLLGLGAIGFTVTTGILAAVGVDGTLALVLGGVAALILIVIGLALDLPAAILVVLTALSGANITVAGVLLLLGELRIAELESGQVPAELPVWAGIAVLALAVVGVIVQSRGLARTRMREAWRGSAVAAR